VLSEDGFTDEYYDGAWCQIASSISSQEEERIRQTLSLIPEGVCSILDVGCGDGRITNRLNSRYSKVVGLENSREALRHVKSEKILGSVESLPLPDRSVDLVLSCEVLEHLPFRVYPKALREIERVAAKYIIVTVPNSENRKQNFVTCPHCGCVFHAWRHLRSFNQERLRRLFGQFSMRTVQSCLASKVYPAFLLKGARFLKAIPDIAFPPTALCPQCGYSPLSAAMAPVGANAGDKDDLSVRLLHSMARWLIPTRKRGRWLMALYQRK